MCGRETCRQTGMTEQSLNDQIDFIEKELWSWSQVIAFLQDEFGQQNFDDFSKEAIDQIRHLQAIKSSLKTLQSHRK